MTELLALFSKYNFAQIVMAVGLMMSRILGMVWLAPFIGGKLVPSQVKIGLAFVIGILLYPFVLSEANLDAVFNPTGAIFPFSVRIVGLVVKEVFIGVVLGFIIVTIWHGAEMIGRFVDTARGSAMGTALVPESGQQVSVFGSLYYQLLLVIFLVLDGHLIFLNYFVQSYLLIPLAGIPRFDTGMWPFFDMMIRITAQLFVAAITLSAPVLIAIFVTDVCMGLFNKVAPQINVLFLMMPFKAVLGVLFSMLALYLFVEESQKIMTVALHKVWLAIRHLIPF